MADPRSECFCEPPPQYGGYTKVGKEEPCYLPQPGDKEAPPTITNADGEPTNTMSPLGPWATGRVDWGPLAGLTGTRPVVDRYTITRYSEGEWREHNADVVNSYGDSMHRANLNDFNSQRCIEHTSAVTDKDQLSSTRRLEQRAHDVHRWKVEIERSIVASGDEINLLESQRQRLKTALGVLRMPEAIAGECLMLRTTRLENDLVRDEVEEELVKEVALVNEVRDLMNRTLKQMEEQLLHCKAVKMRLETDWSDKKETLELDFINIGLRNDSPTILFKLGATRFPEGQSTPASWEVSSRENLFLSEEERTKAVELRKLLECELTDVARDLRTQGDRVDAALARVIAVTDECRQRMENDLITMLKRIADTETLIENLKLRLRAEDQAMKVAQTRLDNRLLRMRAESCRDVPQYGLVDEVKSIAESVSALTAQLNQAMAVLGDLAESRAKLEREVMVKRKSLSIDRDRCQLVRSHYPSAVALTGY